MSQSLHWVFRALVVVISLLVVINFSPVVLDEWKTGDACPKLGPLPACYLVVLCYALMGLAALINPGRLKWLFLIGWVPVFAMALTGTSLELFGRAGTCPATDSGVPMCYYSLTLAVVLLILYWLASGFKKMSVTPEQV